MFSAILIETFADGYLMLTVCAPDERAAWRHFEGRKHAGCVPFYRYKPQ